MIKYLSAISLFLFIYSCKTHSRIFEKKTPHERYTESIEKLGLDKAALGSRWLAAAAKAIHNPIPVQLPYQESGYFATDRPDATGLQFSASRGERLSIELSRVPSANYLLFGDLFLYTNGSTRYIQSIDSVTNLLTYTVTENSSFILRLQPELLQSGSYVITIKIGPSLVFPVPSPSSKNRIISYYGAGRDGGARKHEGIDIGGTRGTPLIAAGEGYVGRVTENSLGGKVIFIRSATSNESWYYAHLDSQLVVNGQKVQAGDTIGLMGNTGNARTTSPHLHFGIYTMEGPIDPLPFINPQVKEPGRVTAPTDVLGKIMRLIGKRPQSYPDPGLTNGQTEPANLPLLITAATRNLYKAVLPGGETRFIPVSSVVPMQEKIKVLSMPEATKLYDAPRLGAPLIRTIPAGAVVGLLGNYGNFQYVESGDSIGWIVQ